VRLLSDEGATRTAMRDGLAWLARQAAADGQATVLVYLSGHGWIDRSSGGYYLLPHDIKPFDVPGSALAGEELTQALRRIDARRLLVIVDSCHAAGMATVKEAATLELPGQFSQTALPKGLAGVLKEGQGRAIFASSRGEQRSWLRPDRTLSLYTYHLLEALHGAGSQPGDDVVRLSHLAAHLSRTVAGERAPSVRGRADPPSTTGRPRISRWPCWLAAKGCRPRAGSPAATWRNRPPRPPTRPPCTAAAAWPRATAWPPARGGIAIGRIGP
jgi:uncharacterized caspase-like protein